MAVAVSVLPVSPTLTSCSGRARVKRHSEASEEQLVHREAHHCLPIILLHYDLGRSEGKL